MDKKLYWASIALATLGLLVSIYMTIYKLTDNNAMCLGSGDCATVNNSIYSEIFGIPVALVGVGGYLAILIVLLLETYGNLKFFKQNGLLSVFGLGVGGFGFTLYLVYVEAFLIRAWCPFCVVSQITMTILFILTTIRLIRQPV
ncbi:MAG: hypothetical protein DDG60_16800 [Anaerolineae bacterium]|nr:MAG: hypothetical protein DDG60_16800 [Anaerolineae bacterium]